jgi:hypothetical protein
LIKNIIKLFISKLYIYMSNIFTKSNLGLKIQGLDSESSIDLHTFLQSSDKKGGSTKFSMTDDTSSFMPQKDGTKLSMTDETSSFMPQKGGSTKFAMTDETSSFMPQKGGSTKFAMTDDTSSFMPQKGGSSKLSMTDDTSSFMPQKGGSSNKTSNDQVEQLISMLTSETEDKHNTATNSTSTSELEIKLRNVLQKGGRKDVSNQLEENVFEARQNVDELEKQITEISKISVYERAAMTNNKDIDNFNEKRTTLDKKLLEAKKKLLEAEKELDTYNAKLKTNNDKFNKATDTLGLLGTIKVAGKTASDFFFGKAHQSPESPLTTGTTTTTIGATQSTQK